jgi:hypothetical protein
MPSLHLSSVQIFSSAFWMLVVPNSFDEHVNNSKIVNTTSITIVTVPKTIVTIVILLVTVVTLFCKCRYCCSHLTSSRTSHVVIINCRKPKNANL